MHKITFFRQKIDPERFAALRNEERYCFFILAHIFNELSLLQRWAFITSKAEFHDGVEGSGNLMQTLFIARLFMAKLFEADKIIRKRYVQEFLQASCFPHMDGRGDELVEQIRVLLNDNPWVRDLRNQQAFHYPRINQLAPALNGPNMVWEIEIFHAPKTANTMYPFADVAVNWSWLHMLNQEEPLAGLEPALKFVRELAIATLDLLEQSVGMFIHTRLRELHDHDEEQLAVAHNIHEFELPFFFDVTDPASSQDEPEASGTA